MIDFINIAQAATETVTKAETETGVLGTLGINWKLFLAQLLNFSVILFILYKFAFKPVGKKLEERREKLDKALKDAEDIEKQKLEFDQWKETEIKRVKSQATAIIASAQSDAIKERAKILGETAKRQEDLVNNAKRQIEEERETVANQIKQEASDMITTAVEKILKEKITDQKDKELIEKTVKNIVFK